MSHPHCLTSDIKRGLLLQRKQLCDPLNFCCQAAIALTFGPAFPAAHNLQVEETKAPATLARALVEFLAVLASKTRVETESASQKPLCLSRMILLHSNCYTLSRVVLVHLNRMRIAAQSALCNQNSTKCKPAISALTKKPCDGLPARQNPKTPTFSWTAWDGGGGTGRSCTEEPQAPRSCDSPRTLHNPAKRRWDDRWDTKRKECVRAY